MLINDVVNILKYGVLKPLAVSNINDTTIHEIITYINNAIVSLYTRFPLSMKTHTINLQDDITEYTLPNDVICVYVIYDEEGEEYDSNASNNTYDISLVGYSTVKVINPSTGDTISMLYQAKADTVSVLDTVENTLNQALPLPYFLLDAMKYKIAAEAYNSVSNKEDFNNIFYTKFEHECKRIEDLGFIPKLAYETISINMNEYI